jgi:hypothetical protein
MCFGKKIQTMYQKQEAPPKTNNFWKKIEQTDLSFRGGKSRKNKACVVSFGSLACLFEIPPETILRTGTGRHRRAMKTIEAPPTSTMIMRVPSDLSSTQLSKLPLQWTEVDRH